MVTALAALGAASPFPIQLATVPDALAGRDVLGRAQTGSGKTIAFAIPVVTALAAQEGGATAGRPAGLVLVPTRELACQVSATIGALAQALGLRCAVVHGGVATSPQVRALRQGADIVVATPGRLEDLVARGHCRLDRVRITVLDEADHLADLGFLPAVRRLLDQTPGRGQRLFFSATLDGAVNVLASRYLRSPVTHSIDPPESSPAHLDHHLFTVRTADKAAVVAELASGSSRSLLFTRTKHAARKLARHLTAAGIPALDLHADLTQRARERNLAAFASGTVRVLVATDIAARGIHVEDVALVVHVDPPADHKAYLHRSGRTARAGAAGAVVTVATPDQTRDVTALLTKAKVNARTGPVGPGDARTAALVGVGSVATPPRHQPAPAAPAAKGPRRPRRASAPVIRGQRNNATATAGAIRWFNSAKGYGFIIPDDGGKDVFVHQSAVKASGNSDLTEGQRVHFETEMGAKGRHATSLRSA
jgi:superfamily II DNA/RNA helicase/cold shock CspA family protein